MKKKAEYRTVTFQGSVMKYIPEQGRDYPVKVNATWELDQCGDLVPGSLTIEEVDE